MKHISIKKYSQNILKYLIKYLFKKKVIDGYFYRPDVYFVTATQALTWMTDPKPIKALHNFEGWSCKKKENLPGPPCNNPHKCALDFKPAEANFTTTR